MDDVINWRAVGPNFPIRNHIGHEPLNGWVSEIIYLASKLPTERQTHDVNW